MIDTTYTSPIQYYNRLKEVSDTKDEAIISALFFLTGWLKSRDADASLLAEKLGDDLRQLGYSNPRTCSGK